jgi:PDZ domain
MKTTTFASILLIGSIPLASADQAGENKDNITTRSSSQSIRTRSEAGGATVTEVTTERDGKRVSRKITVDADGKVSVTDGNEKDVPKSDAISESGGWLGVHTIPLPDALRDQLDIPDGKGIVAEFIADDGPAAAAGMKANDVLLEFDGNPIQSVEDFRKRLRESMPGSQAVFQLLRKGKPQTVSATLGERPKDADQVHEVENEAERLLREMKARHGFDRRTVVIDGDGSTIEIDGEAATTDPFELLLKDPKIPEEAKVQIRKAQDDLNSIRQNQLPEEK